MAFSQVITGMKDQLGTKLVTGTWNAASVTTGTIDIRGTLGGTAVRVPFTILGAGVNNVVSATAPDMLLSHNGTLAITATSNDTGTFWFLLG